MAVDAKTGEVLREVKLEPAPFGITWSIERVGRFESKSSLYRSSPLAKTATHEIRRYPTPDDLVIDRADTVCTAVPMLAG